MQKWLDEPPTQGPYNTLEIVALDKAERTKASKNANAHEGNEPSDVATLGSRRVVDDVGDRSEVVHEAELAGIGAHVDVDVEGCSK